MTSSIKARLASLRARADTIRAEAASARDVAAGLSDADPRRGDLHSAAARLEREAHEAERYLERAEDPGLYAYPAGTAVEVASEQRRQQAVRVGTDVLLPRWPELTTGLPNALLRSGVFGLETGDFVENQPIAAQAGIEIQITGRLMGQEHKRTYATCLEMYRDRALSPDARAYLPPISVRKFLQLEGVSSTNRDMYRALFRRLRDLQQTTLCVATDHINVAIPRLVEVIFLSDAGTARSADTITGSDLIAIRIGPEVAELFAPASWTAVSRQLLMKSGLIGWLTDFFATHAHSLPLPIAYLARLSRSSMHPADFRRKLEEALQWMQSSECPEIARVSSYRIDAAGRIDVRLIRWEREISQVDAAVVVQQQLDPEAAAAAVAAKKEAKRLANQRAYQARKAREAAEAAGDTAGRQ